MPKSTVIEQRRQALTQLVLRYVHHDHVLELQAAIDELVLAAVDDIVGTGACICAMPPGNSVHNRARGLGPFNMLLDHRCALHGEKAQPQLWGRHKDLELLITPDQWDALGIKQPDEQL